LILFLNNQIKINGKWAPPEKFTFAGFDYQNAFYSLEDAMEITKKFDPNAKVPIMLRVLCEKIISLHAFRTEGIFRISAPQTELESMRNKILQNNFEIDVRDVHVPAGMLKEWLRGFNDSLIPTTYYNACITMAKEGNIKNETLVVFLSQLPEANRETIRYLVTFIKKFLDPEIVSITKMNIENFAIVFAPTLLRCPNDDPQTLMLNSKHEQTFIIDLILKLNVQ